MSAEINNLKIDDVDFLVTSLIERCPRVMLLRELVQNGVEAAEHAPRGLRQVVLSRTLVDGVPKLTIWNTGPGMTPDDLFRMCDIAASIRKKMGLDQNFGMGAKVAGLKSNPLGMRYRSCCKGKVFEVSMGRRDDVYGRLRARNVADDHLTDVIDVTKEAIESGRNVNYDWTEVVLLGCRQDQDTIADPYDGDPKVDGNWIVDGLSERYWRLPEGVEIILDPGVHGGES